MWSKWKRFEQRQRKGQGGVTQSISQAGVRMPYRGRTDIHYERRLRALVCHARQGGRVRTAKTRHRRHNDWDRIRGDLPSSSLNERHGDLETEMRQWH
ncbi:hypothetical protein MHYP_G00192560 [Metynnis hypsauchen]